MAITTIPEKGDADNIGGGIHLMVADVAHIDVAQFPELINQNYSEDILLLDDNTWQRWDFIEETIHFKDVFTDADGKIGFIKTIDATRAKDTLEIQQKLNSNRIRRVVAIYYDANGTAKVIGSPEAPAKLTVKAVDHGGNRAARNEYIIELYCAHRDPAPFYLGTIPEPEEGGTPVNELTCIELNQYPEGLTWEQRRIINYIDSRKTGQTTSYFTQDDGDNQFGYGPDFFTLDCLNLFGTTERFTDTLGGQSYADDIMVDHRYTRMVYMVVQGTVPDWDTANSNAQALTVGGFSWALPDEGEIQLWKNIDQADMYNWVPLSIPASPYANLWTGSTNGQNTSQAYRIQPVNGELVALGKGVGGVYFIASRKFIPSDLGF